MPRTRKKKTSAPSRSGSKRSGSKPTSSAAALRQKLRAKSATVAVVGLGYIGLPLARAIFDAGYRVMGYDIDPTKIEKLNRGESYLQHLGDIAHTMSRSKRFAATSDSKALSEADVIILCVPTPLDPHSCPDLTYVIESTRLCASVLRRGQLIVLESTTYPGTTRHEMQPILEATGLVCGEDFFLAYSPEREDPGSANFSTRTIPKLVGGLDDVSTDLAMELYARVVTQAHRVSTAEIAETAKLLENIFRAVNIAMVNELKVVLTDMGIDIWEVISAASTKPFGFMPFFPGPGLGGHCIPIDPFYLTWKAKEIGRYTKFIELAGEINKHMPEYVVSRVAGALNDQKKAIKGSKVLVIGVAYKPNVDDIRESPAAEIIELLWRHGANVSYHDPHMPVFPKMRDHRIDLKSIALSSRTLKQHDCVLIVTDHDAINYDMIGQHADLVVDTRNAMETKAKKRPRGLIVKA